MAKRSVCFFVLLFTIGVCHGQSNDECAGAMELDIGQSCSLTNFDNTLATSDSPSVAPEPSCGSYAGRDIWFKVAVPASGALRIEVDLLQNTTPPSFTLYKGECGNFTEVQCVRNDHRKTVVNPALAGQFVFIRVYGYFNLAFGAGTICVYEPAVPENNNCAEALPLQVHETCQLAITSNAFATAEPGVAPEPSCGEYRGGDIWFRTTLPASGRMWVSKNRIGGATHPAMTVYSGSCNAMQELFCSPNQSLVLIDLPDFAGEELYLQLYSYANEEGAEFSLCLYQDEPPINDDCADAILLATGERCELLPYSSAMATAQGTDVAPDPGCGTYAGGDVWFRTEFPSSGRIRIEGVTPGSAIPPSVTLYTGTCGQFSELLCLSNQESAVVSDPGLAGQTVYLRVYRYNEAAGGPFSICVWEPLCDPVETDAGTIELCPGDTFVFGDQILKESGTYQEVFRSVAGCDSVVSLTVSVVELNVDVSDNGEELTAAQDGASYQWINCDTDRAVPGATGRTFTPTETGNYAILISLETCTVQSHCHPFTVLATEPDHLALNVYPNPAQQTLTLLINDPVEIDEVVIFDMKSARVKTFSAVPGENLIDVRHLAKGRYTLRWSSPEGQRTVGFIKE